MAANNGPSNGTVEEKKVDLATVVKRLREIFLLTHSLTSEEVEEHRALMARHDYLNSLGSDLDEDQLREKVFIYIRLRDLLKIEAETEGVKGREFTSELEEEWLKLTRILLDIREREGKPDSAIPYAESVAANRGVASIIKFVWGKKS